MISVDDHLIEPPDLFSEVPDQFEVPKWTTIDGSVGWEYHDRFYRVSLAATAAGLPWGTTGIFKPATSIPEGLGDPLARVAAMDRDGIEKSLLFPSMMGLGGETMVHHARINRDSAMACVQAYNAFMRHFCRQAPGRFIRAAIVPLWDPIEAGRLARLEALDGAKGILFPQAPHQVGLPPVWDASWAPLFKACQDNHLVLCQHILSDSSKAYFDSNLPPFLPLTLARTSAIETIAAWILTNALDRFPTLKIFVAESGLGWIPWFLSLANESSRLHSHEFTPLELHPMLRFEKHFGVSILGTEQICPELFEMLPGGTQHRVMFESDYPHLDGSYPHSKAAFASLQVPEWARESVARLNAIDFFELEDEK